MTITKVKAYYTDFTDDLEVAKFPEDFADWLMEDGREQDAREFLFTVQHWQEVTPSWDQTIERLVELAEIYAPVVNFSEEIRAPRSTYSEAVSLLRDTERINEPGSEDEPLPWDREAEIINRMIADEALIAEGNMILDGGDENEWTLQEYPDVEVYVDDDDTVVSIALKTFYSLTVNGYDEGARTFLTNIRHLIHRLDYEKMFWIIWTYVTVLPEPGSLISRQWRD